MEIYYQKDPEWSSRPIGNTDIYHNGCVVCCLATLCNYYGKDEDPKTLSIKLNFDKNGNVYWSGLRTIHPDIQYIGRFHCENKPAPMNEIDKYIKEGYPVLVETRHLRKYPHWVLLWKIVNGKHLIVDSLTGDVAFFEDRYGSISRWIYGYTIYKKEIIPYNKKVRELCNEICELVDKN